MNCALLFLTAVLLCTTPAVSSTNFKGFGDVAEAITELWTQAFSKRSEAKNVKPFMSPDASLANMKKFSLGDISNGIAALKSKDAENKGAVPVIDIGALRGTDAAAKLSTIKEISEACERIGFIVITNHGVDQTVIDSAWKDVYDFFSQDEDEKMKWAGMTEEYPYGYEQGEVLSAGKSAEKGEVADVKPDIKETMTIGPSNPASGMPARILPDSPSGYAASIEAYYSEMEGLADILLAAMAVGLDLPEDWFVSKTDHHISALRTLNYPNQETPPEPGQLRAGAHTDYGTLTILRSGGPGLQVAKDKDDPTWVDVPSVPNAFIINLGDLMRRWTNNKYSSTLHRVVNPPLDGKDHRRQSIAFFHNANPDLLVETIPTCLNADGTSDYEPIVAKEFLMMKHMASVSHNVIEKKKHEEL